MLRTLVCTPPMLGLLASLALVRRVDANAFRGRLPDLASAPGVSPELERTLLSEIEEVLGSEHRRTTEGRLGRIEASLRPTFNALPKNEHGRLGHAAVRYAMHRLFVQRHAWFVRGLDPAGEAWNGSSPTLILQDRLPAYIQSLFEQRIGDHGFKLHELAVMAATLENLVHAEAIGRLEHTYRALERSPKDPVRQQESVEVVEAYMAMYVLGLKFSSVTPADLRENLRTILNVYPSWPATQKFVREVHESTAPRREELPFESVASVVEEIGERYGRWQDEECRALKVELLDMEDRGSGRVRLADFYRSAVHEGKWQFSESVQYLRQLGALDESDPSNLRVIIPNYINSPSNCVASSGYYSVCCVDECEEMLRHVEEKLGAPDASPAEIAALVAALPSARSSVNRSLSATLLGRLDEVAQHHGGRVPLHGRLFAQWLHHAYPRECPYPHVTGTTKPQRAEDWMAETGQEATESEKDMRRHAASAQKRPSGDDRAADQQVRKDEHLGVSMWTMEEELLVPRPVPVPERSSPLRGVFCTLAVVSAAVGAYQMINSALSSRPDLLLPKFQKKLKV